MAALPPIDDSNTFPDKTEGGDPGTATDVVSAADLNALKTVISENRAQANAELSAGSLHRADTSTNPHGITPALIGAATTGELAAVSTVANAAVPKPIPAITTGEFLLAGAGGTLAGSGLTTAQFAAQLALYARILTPQVVISASRVLTDADAGKILVCDTAAGAVVLTLPHTIGAEWNAMVLREGANTASVVGSGGMLMKGPASASDTVTIAVDDGGVTLVRRSATKCWAAGVVA